jgi:hypothetical protein
VQTLGWYSAAKGGTPLRYAEYMRTEATDELVERTEAQVAPFVAGQQQGAAARIRAKPAQVMLAHCMSCPLAGVLLSKAAAGLQFDSYAQGQQAFHALQLLQLQLFDAGFQQLAVLQVVDVFEVLGGVAGLGIH